MPADASSRRRGPQKNRSLTGRHRMRSTPQRECWRASSEEQVVGGASSDAMDTSAGTLAVRDCLNEKKKRSGASSPVGSSQFVHLSPRFRLLFSRFGLLSLIGLWGRIA